MISNDTVTIPATTSSNAIPSQTETEELYIRRASVTDSAALSRICLLTADAGVSAEALHTIGEFPGLVYALPYVHLPHTGGFVLVRRGAAASPRLKDALEESVHGKQADTSEGEEAVGYVLFALDTLAFNEAAEREWYPPLRARYPKLDDKTSSSGNPTTSTTVSDPLTEADKNYVSLLHAPHPALPACLAVSPAHMHIDILPAYQRRGWGRKLIDAAVKYMRDEAGLNAVWLGMDKRNLDAASFYKRLGFKQVEGAPETNVWLEFKDWVVGS